MEVGRIVDVLYDGSRKDRFSDDEYRAIIVSIYYPAKVKDAQHKETSYMDLFEPCTEQATNVFKSMGVDIDYFSKLRTKVHNNAEPHFSETNYPVILYAPAFGVTKDMYIYHIKQLVDCGFVVVSIGSTNESIFSIFPDGRFINQADVLSNINSTDFQLWTELLETRVEDILHVINHLEELLTQSLFHDIDYSTVGIIGHSLGGLAAFEAAKRDNRIRAGVMFDASFHLINVEENDKIHTPFLIMRQEKCSYDELRNELSEGIIDPFIIGFERFYDILYGYKSFLKVPGTHHMSFCDVPVHFKEEKISEKHEIISKYATAFLSEFMQNNHAVYQKLIDSKQLDEVVEIDKRGNDYVV